MNELQVFNYQSNEVRTVMKDGEPWFVLKDVCDVLGIVKHTNVSLRLDDDEKGACLMGTPSGQQNMTIINESGLYNVILRSDKPEAKPFRKWVTSEVLPSIRTKGTYSVQPMTQAQLIAAQAQILVDMEQKMQQMENHTLALEEKVDSAIRIFSRPAEDHWKSDMDTAIKQICQQSHGSLLKIKGMMYQELEQAAGCNIASRLTHLRQRKKSAGIRHREVMALTKLDAIAADKQLRAIFEGIVRSWQAKAAVKEGL